MTPSNVSKADEIFKNWRHTNEPMTEEDLVMELRDHAKSLESSLTQAQGEIEGLRKVIKEAKQVVFDHEIDGIMTAVSIPKLRESLKAIGEYDPPTPSKEM